MIVDLLVLLSGCSDCLLVINSVIYCNWNQSSLGCLLPDAPFNGFCLRGNYGPRKAACCQCCVGWGSEGEKIAGNSTRFPPNPDWLARDSYMEVNPPLPRAFFPPLYPTTTLTKLYFLLLNSKKANF